MNTDTAVLVVSITALILSAASVFIGTHLRRPRSTGSLHPAEGHRVTWYDPDQPNANGQPGKRTITFDDPREAARFRELHGIDEDH